MSRLMFFSYFFLKTLKTFFNSPPAVVFFGSAAGFAAGALLSAGADFACALFSTPLSGAPDPLIPRPLGGLRLRLLAGLVPSGTSLPSAGVAPCGLSPVRACSCPAEDVD